MKGFLVWAFMWLSMVGTVLAADLNVGLIRLNRSQNGQSPIPILVEFKTDNLVSENGVRVTLGGAWDVNGIVKSEVATLPPGVVAVPNISSIGTVNGKELDFSCDDLTPGILYGFYISDGISNNSIATDSDYLWKIASLTGGSVDSQKNVRVAVTDNDQLIVTGKVATNQTEMELNLGVAQTGVLSQNQRVDFHIDYASLMAGSINPLIIKASWSRGTVAGSPIPNVDIFDYMVGSATNGYGEAVPVIDTVNRTITWTISNYPAGLGTKTVYFSLKTNDNYTGSSQVNLEINSALIVENNTVITSNLNSIYQYINSPVSVVRVSDKFVIEKVEITSLNNVSAEIRVVVSDKPEEIKIKYGLSTGNLNKTIISLNGLVDDRIRLDDLKPGTVYYFQVEARRGAQNTVKSEIYTFTTTKTGRLVTIVPGSFIVTVQNSLLFEAQTLDVKDNVVVIPSQENYSVKIDLENPDLVKVAKVFVRNNSILGITSVYGAEPASGETDLMEIEKGKFSGQLRTSNLTGFYGIYARVTDIYGNIFEEIIGYVRVVEALKVVDIKEKALEGASIKVWRFNQNNKTYEVIPSRPLSPNPLLTDVYGQANLVLPMGKYRVEVEALNFASETVDFTVGIGEDEIYPVVKMSRRILSINQLFRYYGKIMSDSISYGTVFFTELGKSSRFLRLATLLQMLASCLFLLILVGKFFRVSWWLVPWWMLGVLFNRNKKNGISGKIVNQINNMGIMGAKVFLIDGDENRNLAEVKSGIGGDFWFDLIPAKSYKIFWKKSGYEIPVMRDYEVKSVENFLIELPLKKNGGFRNWLTIMETNLIKVIYGTWAVITMCLSYFFVRNIGNEATYFLVMAIFNVILYSVFAIVFNKKNEEIS